MVYGGWGDGMSFGFWFSLLEKARKILGKYKNLDLRKELILMSSE
ncbi:MAG: hypothetical protein RLZZ392_222 [Pseudomonadota bacterium]|jgi:hypothetical protein